MSNLFKSLSLILIVLNVSCASKLHEFSESEEEYFKYVKIVTSDQNIGNCTFIAPVEVFSYSKDGFFSFPASGTYTNAVKLLQYETKKKGGDIAVIDSLEPPYYYSEYNLK